jgi:acyl carrier protein
MKLAAVNRAFAAMAMLALIGPTMARAGDAPDMADVTQRVRKVVQEQLGTAAAALDDDKSLTGYGMDELDVVEIVMALEEEFDIQIPDEAMEPGEGGWNAITTRFLVDVVVQRLRKREG